MSGILSVMGNWPLQLLVHVSMSFCEQKCCTMEIESFSLLQNTWVLSYQSPVLHLGWVASQQVTRTVWVCTASPHVNSPLLSIPLLGTDIQLGKGSPPLSPRNNPFPLFMSPVCFLAVSSDSKKIFISGHHRCTGKTRRWKWALLDL